ncbi:MAG: ABC transporter substrate-binding protein [Nitratireductor sp.]|nr:ABC transporter substrate-binding protein [Nitratireductor sp.]
MKRRQLIKAAATFATAATLSTTALISTGFAADDVFRVVVLGGLSAKGILADNSSTSVLAAQAGAEIVNKNGGIGGKKVVVEVLDDQANPTVAVTKLREAINSSSKPDAVLNSGPSTIAEATLPIINQAGILSFNIGPTKTSWDAAKFPLNFDLSPAPANYASGFLDYIKVKGYKSVGIIHGNSAYGEALGTLMEKTVSEGGVTVTAKEGYDYSALDMTPQLDKIKSTNPEALIVDGYGSVVGYVLQGIQKLGWDIPLLGDNSIAATGLISKTPPDGVLGTDAVKNLVMQVFSSTKYDPDATGVNEAVATMKSLGPIKASLILAYNYDALALMAAAAEAAGSTDAKAMAAALETDAVTTAAKTEILKKYNFSKESHAANPSNDSFAFIAPSELKDGQYQ